jgi:UDP-2,3-diacylglucosamine pyrophosphatase LpxH
VPEGYVISDLHLGAGADNPLEDFRDDDALTGFVESLGGDGVTLVINGDFVDFAQIEPLSVEDLPSWLLWDEEASVQKLETAIAGHRSCFDALGEFISRGGALRLVIGNHDFDFAWQAVQQRFREAVADDDRRAVFTVGGDGYQGVHIEHGYQFSPENCPKDPVNFIHDWEEHGRRRKLLERVWGTDFLLRFFNQLEQTHPFVDNVKPTISLAWHGLRAGWIPKRALVEIAVFLKRRGIPWRAIGSTLDESKATLETVRQAFEEQSWSDVATEAVSSDPEAVSAAISELSPEDRAVLAAPGPVKIGEDAMFGDGETLRLFRSGTREEAAARDRLGRAGVTHVVFGHTHDVVDGSLAGSLYNPGSWIPHLDLHAEYVKAKIRKDGITLELLNDERLYVVERRAIRIRPERARARVDLIDCT